MKAYEEIMNALKLYYAEDGDVLTDESVYEIIGQAHEPLGTVAKALDEYRAANSPELPDGWKLVPIAPTPEMEKAISDGIYNDLYTTGIYADLLAAAPTPPTTEK